jgi:hypothetical protein
MRYIMHRNPRLSRRRRTIQQLLRSQNLDPTVLNFHLVVKRSAAQRNLHFSVPHCSSNGLSHHNRRLRHQLLLLHCHRTHRGNTLPKQSLLQETSC